MNYMRCAHALFFEISKSTIHNYDQVIDQKYGHDIITEKTSTTKETMLLIHIY